MRLRYVRSITKSSLKTDRNQNIIVITELDDLYEFSGLYGSFCSLDGILRFTLCDMINLLHFSEKRADVILQVTHSLRGGFRHDWEEDVCLRRAHLD